MVAANTRGCSLMRLRVWGASPRTDQELVRNLRSESLRRGVPIEVEYVDILTRPEESVASGVVETPVVEEMDGSGRRIIARPREPAKILDALLAESET